MLKKYLLEIGHNRNQLKTKEVSADYFNYDNYVAKFYASTKGGSGRLVHVYTEVHSVNELPSKSSKLRGFLVAWYLLQGLLRSLVARG